MIVEIHPARPHRVVGVAVVNNDIPYLFWGATQGQ